jgi:ankyrin repeat protein
MSEPEDPRAAFIEAGVGRGTLERAEAILAAHPEVRACDVHTAAILGDDAAVRRFLAEDARNATGSAGPLGWDALTHLCFSRYLRLGPDRGDAFVRAAKALLDAGADAATGYFEDEHTPPGWESALYGAAGVAHHAELARLLLERGADPNDDETVYHAPETQDNAVLRVLVASGRLSPDSLATLLARKADWHDEDGVRFLLEHRADPNRMTRWGFTALHQAARRDDALPIFERMLDHGADPEIPDQRRRRGLEATGQSAIAIAARRGRGDVLALLERRRGPLELPGVLSLIAACARNDVALVRAIAEGEPEVVAATLAEGGQRLAEFAGAGNTEGVRHLLDLGVDPGAAYHEDDGYWQLGRDSTALHVAAWRARHATVRLLLERGAPVDARDGLGRTPLVLAVRACVDSHWTDLRSPESVRALLAARASTSGVHHPCGYAEVDDLIRTARG